MSVEGAMRYVDDEVPHRRLQVYHNGEWDVADELVVVPRSLVEDLVTAVKDGCVAIETENRRHGNDFTSSEMVGFMGGSLNVLDRAREAGFGVSE